MYNDSNQNPLEGHNPDSIPVVAARKPVLTMDALNWIKSNPKEKEEVKEKEKTFFEQLQATMMQFEMERLLAQMQQQRLQQYRDGGKVVKEVDSLTPAERKWYLENGYDIEEDGVMEYGKGGPVNGDNTIPDSFYIESNVLPVVEIKGKRRAGSSTVSLTPSDQPTNSEFKKKDNVKENLKWLAMLTADTATDQIPNSEHVKMAYDGYKGNPITGLMNYAKIPAPIILDMLINMMQNNPTGIDTEHLDGYFKGQFEDKSLSNKVSNQYAKGGKVQSYKGGGKINPDEVVTFGEYKNVPFGMLSPEAQQEYKDSKSREIATGVKTEKSSSTRTDIKAGSTEHNVHVSAFPNPDKPLKEHGNPKTTKALRTLSGVDKNELQKSLAVDDLDLLYTLEQEFANNPAYNYSWYHKSKDIWPSAHVPTKQDTVNYNAMLGAVNDYGSKDYHVNDSSYTPTTGDVIRSILGYPAVEHSNGMSIQDMSMLPAELAHRYQQNNGLLNTQRFLTDVVTKGGLGMNYRALYDDATSFEGEAHSLIEPVLKEEFSVRQAREKLRLDGAKIVPTSDEDLVEQSRKTIQKVLSQYAKGGSVQQYPGGSKVYDDKTSQMLIVDKDNMQIFNTKGEQLDWQDFEDREWSKMPHKKTSAEKKKLIEAKKKEWEESHITSDFAAKRKVGSEDIVRLLNNAQYNVYNSSGNNPYYDLPFSQNLDALQTTATMANEKDRHGQRPHALLNLMFGVRPDDDDRFSPDLGVSSYAPTKSSEDDYYFSLLEGLQQHSGQISHWLAKPYKYFSETTADGPGAQFLASLIKEGMKLPVGKNSVSNLKGNPDLGRFTIGHGIDNEKKLRYVSMYDKWDLDPTKGKEALIKLLPDKVLKRKLDAIGVPEELHPAFMSGLREGKALGEILGFGNAPEIYDRVYYNPKDTTIVMQPGQFNYSKEKRKLLETNINKFIKGKNYKHGGEVIDEYEVDSMTPEEIAKLQAEGYDVEVDGVMHYAKVKTKQNGKNKNY